MQSLLQGGRNVPGTQGRTVNGSKAPFLSMCPKCAQLRAQPGYDRNSLLRLLRNRYPVEAHCAACDEYWSISTMCDR